MAQTSCIVITLPSQKVSGLLIFGVGQVCVHFQEGFSECNRILRQSHDFDIVSQLNTIRSNLIYLYLHNNLRLLNNAISLLLI